MWETGRATEGRERGRSGQRVFPPLWGLKAWGGAVLVNKKASRLCPSPRKFFIFADGDGSIW